MFTTQIYVMITVNFPVNGQPSTTFCHFEHKSVKGFLRYTRTERHGQIVKWEELCGLVSSMKVS